MKNKERKVCHKTVNKTDIARTTVRQRRPPKKGLRTQRIMWEREEEGWRREVEEEREEEERGGKGERWRRRIGRERRRREGGGEREVEEKGRWSRRIGG